MYNCLAVGVDEIGAACSRECATFCDDGLFTLHNVAELSMTQSPKERTTQQINFKLQVHIFYPLWSSSKGLAPFPGGNLA